MKIFLASSGGIGICGGCWRWGCIAPWFTQYADHLTFLRVEFSPDLSGECTGKENVYWQRKLIWIGVYWQEFCERAEFFCVSCCILGFFVIKRQYVKTGLHLSLTLCDKMLMFRSCCRDAEFSGLCPPTPSFPLPKFPWEQSNHFDPLRCTSWASFCPKFHLCTRMVSARPLHCATALYVKNFVWKS